MKISRSHQARLQVLWSYTRCIVGSVDFTSSMCIYVKHSTFNLLPSLPFQQNHPCILYLQLVFKARSSWCSEKREQANFRLNNNTSQRYACKGHHSDGCDTNSLAVKKNGNPSTNLLHLSLVHEQWSKDL